MTKEIVLISGGSGAIGRKLIKELSSANYEIRVLSRSNKKIDGAKTFIWHPDKLIIDENALKNLDYIIHLSGTNIGEKRWTKKRKEEIISSRVKTAELIFEKIRNLDKKPKAFISASASGIYGAINSQKVYSEDDVDNIDFLSEVGIKWEAAADKFESLGIRVAKIRTPVVLDKNSGFYKKIKPIVKMNLASPLGSGKQYVPWIHIHDLINIYKFAIENNDFKGAYNAASLQHINNKDLMKSFAKSLNRFFLPIPVPAFLLKIIFGEMSAIILKGVRINSDKLIKQGFNFKFDEINKAFKDLTK